MASSSGIGHFTSIFANDSFVPSARVRLSPDTGASMFRSSKRAQKTLRENLEFQVTGNIHSAAWNKARVAVA